MKQVLIKPVWGHGLNNRLFETIYGYTLTLWRESAAKLGIALDSWDMMPLHKADCILFQDLPDTKKELINARKEARSGIPFVLQVMETPAGRTQNFEISNQELFDYVITYQQISGKHKNYFSYRLPHSLVCQEKHLEFEKKKISVLINSNRVEGFFAMRQAGIVGIPGLGRSLSGWSLPAWAYFQPARDELYSWRRKLARLASVIDGDVLDVFGPGWKGEKISWCPFFSNKPYANCRGGFTTSKLSIVGKYRFCISVENYRGSHDYISEKLFDPILAGTVPVYLGDENITQLISPKAFVDVRNFKTQKELLLYLRSCSKSEWEDMYHAGQDFLATEKAQEFKTEKFIENMNKYLCEILNI